MNLLKKENFITEIQCKTDIYFHLILVGRGVKQLFLAIRQILLHKSNLVTVPYAFFGAEMWVQVGPVRRG